MNSVNKTLYIPLYGKAYVSKKGVLLKDKKAETIWEAEGFALKGKSKSKWLAYYMGMRSAVFDTWLREQMEEKPEAVVLHLGCGMDSRAERVGTREHLWFDVDFPDVIRERKRYYEETKDYKMIATDVRVSDWITRLPKDGAAIVVMEGISMYLAPEERNFLLSNLKNHFADVCLLMDCYTVLATEMSKYKNPINDVGVTVVYGMDQPKELEEGTGLVFVKEHEMTPNTMIDELKGFEKLVFTKLYAGKIAKKMYRLYEYSNK